MDTEARRTETAETAENANGARSAAGGLLGDGAPEEERNRVIPRERSFDESDERAAGWEEDGARSLWTVEPAVRPPMPGPVRTAAVRAGIIVAVTLIMAMVAFLCTMAAAWFAFPAVLGTVGGTIVATWSVLDVWITRQVWNQRNGVVSVPSSTARALRRERRRARRAARAAARSRPSGGSRLSRA